MLPDNATYLKFPRSDGSEERWPTDKLDSTPNEMGEVNFMKHVDIGTPANTRWRTLVGREVAKLLGKPSFENYVLEDFPQGYRLYEHNKGAVGKIPRTDLYLFGAPSARFRSSAEFVRHAYWLMTDETLDRQNCQCKYCDKKPQHQISQALGIRHSTSSLSKAPEIPVDINRVKLRQVPIERGKENHQENPNMASRVSELLSKRCFRSGEVIWCAIHPPIQGQQEHDRIEFWPVLVMDLRLQTDVRHNNQSNTSWSVSQTYQYKVKFLGIGCSEVVTEHALLPYQAYVPTPALIDRLRAEGDPNLLAVKGNFLQTKLQPLGSNIAPYSQLSFKEAATPFALSIQISAHVLRYWTPVYEFAFWGNVPSWEKGSQNSHTIQKAAIKETRHEGLWWGAERIWADEVVRLVPFRGQVLQDSTYIQRPSPQSGRRGVLMRLNAIISRQSAGERERICKVAGTLYELAHEDFQEDEQKQLPAPPAGSMDASTSENVHVQNFAAVHSANVQSSTKTLPNQPTPLIPPSIPNLGLPKPPQGYKLRPITPPGYEIVLDVAMIAGRYYPDILQNTLLKNMLESTHADDPQIGQLKALCGLDAGAINSMECLNWCESRSTMIQQAQDTALSELINYWTQEPTPEVYEGS